jgi:hypothetical protein
MKHLVLPTYQWLEEYLQVNRDMASGLMWRRDYRHIKAGTMAGSINTNGYYQVRIKSKLYLTHRIVYCLLHKQDPGDQIIDHRINKQDHLSIRIATYSQNSFYSKKQEGTTSKYKGVCWDRNKWRAKISYQRKVYNLGRFETEEEAALAYDKKALELDPLFAFLNFPQSP